VGGARAESATRRGDDPGAVTLLISLAASAASVCLAFAAGPAWAAVERQPGAFAAFFAIALLLGVSSVEVYGRGTFSFSGAAILAVGFEFGIGAAMAVALATIALHYARRRGRLHRAVFTAAVVALAAAAATLPYVALGAADWSLAAQLVPVLAAGPLYLAVNTGLLAVAMGVSEGRRALSIWNEQFRWMVPYYVASAPLAFALVIAYQQVGLAGLFAFALPPAFMMLSVHQYVSKTRAGVEQLQRTNDELADRNDDLRRLLEFAGGLAARSHDRTALLTYAEEALRALAGAPAAIRIGTVDGGVPLEAGGSHVGSILLEEHVSIDRERWARLQGTVLPQLATAIESAELVERLLKTHRETIAALSRSMEAKDWYTGTHTERVSELAVALARRLGYAGAALDAIEIGALLHDVGKIGIPERILHKPEALDDEEWRVMKEHPVISDFILSGIDLDPIVRQIARSSHERIDGFGYPDGLAGDDIPLPARIVLVADAFDAMTSERPYRPARPVLAALNEIRTNAGTQFCRCVVAALEQVFREEPELVGNAPLRAVS
jgi:putative nucleotidyltransferase with HDIG domain